MRKKENCPRDLSPLLGRVNDGIERFIREAVETSFDKAQWGALAELFEPVCCWKIKGCKKRNCPSYKNAEKRCWLTVGTFCHGKVQGDFARKYKTCYECEVFNDMSGGPVRRLYENINTLISFLKDEARKLRLLAIRDPLTQLYNRHFFNEVIEREAARSERNKEPMSFIMIDLDNFKRVNDTLGHLSGDGVLVQVAGVLQRAVRKADLVFRFGGDEFLVLMTNADCHKAARMAERLSAAAERWNRENAVTFGCRISFSIGCATRTMGVDVYSALGEADTRMYRHKKTKKR